MTAISVVMSTYNDSARLAETIDSVLDQTYTDFEFIIVNDGSSDDSSRILAQYANREPRIRVIEQQNNGLTCALITGCAVARGKYIARQDVGDISFPDRLAEELACITRDSDIALVSCGTRYVGPAGEFLYDNVFPGLGDLRSGLLSLDTKTLSGISHHGTAMFPRELYGRVGGYRKEFYFAQDLDLWVRFAEKGKVAMAPKVLYQARFEPESLSGYNRGDQLRVARLILECARLRRAGLSESPVLKKAEAIKLHSRKMINSARREADALYFIGMCLNKNDDPRAIIYLKLALRAFPFHLRSAVRLLFR